MTHTWAREVVRDLNVDSRVQHRAAELLSQAYLRPGGKLGQVFVGSAQQIAARRHLRDSAGHYSDRDLDRSICHSTLRRAAGYRELLVPVDGTKLRWEPRRTSGLGPISRARGTRGVRNITALALSPDEQVTVGLLHQKMWVRPPKVADRQRDRHKRRPHEKETRYWLETINTVRKRCLPFSIRPCFIIDREGDCQAIFKQACNYPGQLNLLIRMNLDRKIDQDPVIKVRQFLSSRPVAGVYAFELPARPKGQWDDGPRPARQAIMEIRFGCCRFEMYEQNNKKKRFKITLSVVQAREVSPPAGATAVEWCLMTTLPVNDIYDAAGVLSRYRCRWRIEEYFQTWKSSSCRVEDIRLGDVARCTRWARMLGVIAVRVQRLKDLARTENFQPATTAFTQTELQWLCLVRKKELPEDLDKIDAREAIIWLAIMGGYNEHSRRPPGPTVIKRGLQQMESGVFTLQLMREASDTGQIPKGKPPDEM